MENTLARRVVAEFIGTFLLLVAAGHVFSTAGILRLYPNGTKAAATLGVINGVDKTAEALAVGITLAVMVVLFGAISGGHFNPMVSLAAMLFRGLTPAEFASYAVAQIAGGIGGVITAQYIRSGLPNGIVVGKAGMGNTWDYVSEFIATLALVAAVHGTIRAGRANLVPLALGGWVVVSVASLPQGFGNTAIAIANFFTGKAAPNFGSIALFIGVEIVAALGAWVVVSYLYPEDKSAPAATYTTF
jgi:arsenate reductase